MLENRYTWKQLYEGRNQERFERNGGIIVGSEAGYIPGNAVSYKNLQVGQRVLLNDRDWMLAEYGVWDTVGMTMKPSARLSL